MQSDNQQLKTALLHQTDLCVKCGMCSTLCPTYLITQDENESPRGRISLIQAFLTRENIKVETIQKHLDNCLSCKHCEKLCPSKVPYTQIKDTADELLLSKTTASHHIQRASTIKLSKWSKYAALYRLTYSSGLLKLANLFFYSRFKNYLREPVKPGTTSTHEQQVQIFAGCMANIFDQQTQASLLNILEACKISAKLPSDQQCCGALAHHNKHPELAAQCKTENTKAFSKDIPILFTTSGCGAHIKRNYVDEANPFAGNIFEAGEYLLQQPGFSQLKFKALNQKILIHAPCSEKNDLKTSNSAALVQCIPEAKLINMPDSTPCCGASGNYMLKHPEEAQQIRSFTEEAIARIKPDILVTTNYPCAMHIAAGLKEKGLDIKVMHPLSLLQQQLNTR